MPTDATVRPQLVQRAAFSSMNTDSHKNLKTILFNTFQKSDYNCLQVKNWIYDVTVNISNLCSSFQYTNIQKGDLNPSAVHYNWAVIFKNTIFTQELADRKHPECGKQHKRLSQSFVCRHNLSVKEADVVPQICCFILTKVFSCCQADFTHRQRGSRPTCQQMFIFKILVVTFFITRYDTVTL